jgi:hypothetical protein
VIAVVAVVFMTSGKKETPGTANAASKEPAAAPAAATPPATPPPAATPPAAADKPADKPAAAPAPAAPAAATPPAVPEPDADPNRPKRPWETIKGITSMEQVTDPKTYPEVVWPAGTDDTVKAQIRALCDDVKNGGRAGIRAKEPLIKHDYLSLFGIVEKLRDLDYKSNDESMTAFEFNKLLEQITFEINARFEPVEANETLHPKKAEWNTRTVKAWRALLDKFPDATTFNKDRAERRKKAAGDEGR